MFWSLRILIACIYPDLFPKIILWPDKDSQETTLYFVIFPLQESIMAEIDFLKNEIIGLLRHIKQWTKDQWVIFQLFYFTGLLVKLKIFIWSWSYCVHGFGVCQLSLFHYQMLSYDLPSSSCVLVHSIIWWLDKKFETAAQLKYWNTCRPVEKAPTTLLDEVALWWKSVFVCFLLLSSWLKGLESPPL